MSCTESFCWSGGLSLSPPDFPPPPPLPSFIHQALQVANVTDTCDLCSKWSDIHTTSAGQSSGDNFTLVISIVAVISALAGAGIMAAILSVKRLRNRKFQNATDSVRHLERKCNEQSIPLPPSRSSNSTPMTNTYCEGPYNDKEYPSNIYAELQTSQADIWRRPPIPTPTDNCYLELRDLPGSCEGLQCLHSPSHSHSPSTTTASYYTDLDIKCSELR